MKFKKFDVVELKNKNRATILEKKNNEYLVEIVDTNGITVEKKNINQEDIKQVIYTRHKKFRL